MAQNQFINLTVDGNASKKNDIGDIRHSGGGGPSASGDVTLSWDSAEITNLNVLRSAVQQMMSIAAGQMK
jgi:hypothetical protein